MTYWSFSVLHKVVKLAFSYCYNFENEMDIIKAL